MNYDAAVWLLPAPVPGTGDAAASASAAAPRRPPQKLCLVTARPPCPGCSGPSSPSHADIITLYPPAALAHYPEGLWQVLPIFAHIFIFKSIFAILSFSFSWILNTFKSCQASVRSSAKLPLSLPHTELGQGRCRQQMAERGVQRTTETKHCQLCCELLSLSSDCCGKCDMV